MSCFLHRMKRKEERKLALAQKVQKQLVEQGYYNCSCCGNQLFQASKKFDSGTGFPSFWEHVGDNVKENFLDTYGRVRVQLLCRSCGSHLGHLFPNKLTPTKLRYCINAESILLEKDK